MYNILQQAVYMHPDDFEALNEDFENFLTAVDTSEIDTLYNDYITALNDDIEGNSEEAYKKLEDSVQRLQEKYPFAQTVLSNFVGTAGGGANVNDSPLNNIETLGSLAKTVVILTKQEHSEDKDSSDIDNSDIVVPNIFMLENSEGEATALSNLKDSLDSVISSYKTLKDAVSEFHSTGKLSLETIESLISQGDDWLDYIDLENGQLKLNEENLYKVAEAKMYQLKVQALENIADNVKGIKDAASAQAYLKSTLYDTSSAYDTYAGSIYNATLAQLEENLVNADSEADKQAIEETIEKFKNDFSKVNDIFNNADLEYTISGNADTGGLSGIISDLNSLADLIDNTEKEITDSGKISAEQIQNIASQYPLLEELLMNYLNGKASEADIVNALKDIYATDAENYSKYYADKMSKDNSFYQNMIGNLPDALKELANFYDLDLANYGNYVQAKLGLDTQLAEAQQKLDFITDNPLSYDDTWSGVKTTTGELIANNLFSEFNDSVKEQAQGKIDTINQIKAEFENLSQPVFDTKLDLSDYNSFVSNSSDSSNSSSSADQKDPETFDWIERAINNLNNSLDLLKTKADDTYTSWASRNENLAGAIARTQQAIDLQSQAYSRYMAQADSVALSDSWKRLVQNGAVDISMIADEDLAKNIKEYEEWYDKANDCLQTQQDLQSSLNELNSQKFENIHSEYESIINLMESQKELLENQVNVLSSKNMYDTLRSEQANILYTLQNERAALQNTLNSLNIEVGTEKWNELNESVTDIDKSIQDAHQKLQEINKMQFDNLKEFYQLSIDLMESQKDLSESRITLLSSSGDYENLRKQQSGILDGYRQQLNALNELKSSDVFYGMSYEDQMGTLSEITDITQSLEDAGRALQEINKMQFDNVNDFYQNTIDLMESRKELSENRITLLSSSEDYDKLRKQQEDIINHSKQMLDELNRLVNSNVYYGMSYEDQTETLSTIEGVKQSLDDSYNALKEISQLQFDNVKEIFEFKTSKLEHNISLMDDMINLAQAQGLMTSEDIYQKKKNNLKSQYSNVEDEISKLIEIRDASGYEIGTSEWNSMTQEIISLREQESSLVNEIQDVTNALRDLEWEISDYLNSSVSVILDESTFLTDLLGKNKLIDKQGKFTEEGQASLAMHLVNADINKQLAESFWNNGCFFVFFLFVRSK